VADVEDGRRPDDPVARLVPGAGRGHDRLDDRVDELVLDEEDEQRLRQEARLEDAAAVLVRDPGLAAVAHGLEHGHAHVPRPLGDRVHHRLDPVPHDDCLDLQHPIPPASDHEKSARNSRSSREAP